MLRRKKNLKTAATCIKKRDTVIDNDTKKKPALKHACIHRDSLKKQIQDRCLFIKKKKKKKN